MTRYGTHPLRNSFTPGERDLLTTELVKDPTSRTSAAIFGVAADLFAAFKTAEAVTVLAGGAPESVYSLFDPPLAEQETTPAEVQALRAVLLRYSAISTLEE